MNEAQLTDDIYFSILIQLGHAASVQSGVILVWFSDNKLILIIDNLVAIGQLCVFTDIVSIAGP